VFRACWSQGPYYRLCYGARLVGYCLKVLKGALLTGRFVIGPRSWALVFGRFVPGSSFLDFRFWVFGY
jgi:hypothetical protein